MLFFRNVAIQHNWLFIKKKTKAYLSFNPYKAFLYNGRLTNKGLQISICRLKIFYDRVKFSYVKYFYTILKYFSGNFTTLWHGQPKIWLQDHSNTDRYMSTGFLFYLSKMQINRIKVIKSRLTRNCFSSFKELVQMGLEESEEK